MTAETQTTPLFDWKTTALVVIDLQNGLRANKYAPYSVEQVITNAAILTEVFRKQEAFVVLVHVSTQDWKDMLRPKLDQAPPVMNPGEGWDKIVPEIGITATDHVITKKQWGAFYGTDLDLQLRRRGIKTIVIGGIASGIGVDTTAREAFQHGYDIIFASDAMSGFSEAEHKHVQDFIFPRMGRIRTTQAIVSNLNV
jgi:nicotinamidase-related amidase